MILETHRLAKQYGHRTGLDALTISLNEGSVCGFLGPNGVGKSTTIRLLLGFLRPSSGHAHLMGFDCWSQSHLLKEHVGYLPGDLRLYPWLTLENGVRMISRIRRRPLAAAARELAEAFQLEPRVRVSQMSRGMRQKLGLIFALAHEPRVLVLDEPTSGLDPVVQERLLGHLQMLANRGHTVLFSSHALGEVERLCERVVILRNGRAVADDTVDSLRERCSREVVLHWPDATVAARTPPPEGLSVVRREPGVWRCTLSGPVTNLLPWLSRQPLKDFSVGQPNLERLFQSYYQEPTVAQSRPH